MYEIIARDDFSLTRVSLSLVVDTLVILSVRGGY